MFDVIEDNETDFNIECSKNPFKNNSINLFYVNIRSLKNKIGHLRNQLVNFRCPIHFVCIAESWLTDDILRTNLVELQDFRDIHSIRPLQMGRGGGCSLYAHKSIGEPLEVETFEFYNSNVVIARFEKLSLKLCVIYRETKTPLQEFLDFFDRLLERHPGTIVVGDFNINLLNTNYSQDYINLINSRGFSIVNPIDPSYSTCENRFGK